MKQIKPYNKSTHRVVMKIVKEQPGIVTEIRILERELKLLQDRYKTNELFLKMYHEEKNMGKKEEVEGI